MTRKRQHIGSTNSRARPDEKIGAEARIGHTRSNRVLKQWAKKKRRQRDKKGFIE